MCLHYFFRQQRSAQSMYTRVLMIKDMAENNYIVLYFEKSYNLKEPTFI